MELEVYIQRIQEFYNSTISTLDSQRKDHARREWAEIQQSERESVPEFRQRISDIVHRYNSVMPEALHLPPTEIGEVFTRKLNSKFADLKIKSESEQIIKNRIIEERSPEPVPYLEHTGYPTSLEAAYNRAIEYEETLRNYKVTSQHLSSFATVRDNHERTYTNKTTGEVKTLSEMTKDDIASEYGIGKCHICKKNGSQYKGNHFASVHDEFVQHRRNMHKDKDKRSKPSVSKSKGKQGKDANVKVALATLRHVARSEESKAKKAEKNMSKAKEHSEKAKTITQLLSTFE